VPGKKGDVAVWKNGFSQHGDFWLIGCCPAGKDDKQDQLI